MTKRKLYDVPYRERVKIAKGIVYESRTYCDRFDPIHVQGVVTTDSNGTPQILVKSFRNRHFLVQVYSQGNWVRLSVNRTAYDPIANTWVGGITWDELMEVKRGIGFGEYDAIEIYPRDGDIVDVTNMRHLFIAKDGSAPDCIWRKGDKV